MAKSLLPILLNMTHLWWDEKTIREQIRLRIDALHDSPNKKEMDAEIELLEARLDELHNHQRG